MNNSKKFIIVGFILISAIGVVFYINNLRSLLKNYIRIQLELHSVRNKLEDIGQKDFAYTECAVQHSFIDMWFPWTFHKIISETEIKIERCTDELEYLKKNGSN